MMAPRAGHRMPKSQRKAWKMSWIGMFISFVFYLGLCVLDVVTPETSPASSSESFLAPTTPRSSRERLRRWNLRWLPCATRWHG
jgi:hypothetical protein